jgi:hypothetical protein
VGHAVTVQLAGQAVNRFRRAQLLSLVFFLSSEQYLSQEAREARKEKRRSFASFAIFL